MKPLRSIPLILAAAVLVTPAMAHSQGVSIAAGAGYYTLSGDFDADAGLGIDGVIRLAIKPNFQLGLAVQRNTHFLGLIEDDITVLGIMIEPRYVVALKGSSLRPFVGGRVGWVRESASIGEPGDQVDASANGFTIGALGGLAFAVSPAMSLETSVVLQHVSMGEIKLEDEFLEDSGQSGMSLGLRVGVSIALGRR